MKKLLLGSLLCVLTSVATAQESVLQLFACNLNEGKTMENVWSTLETMRGLSGNNQELTDPGFGVFLWTPFRGSLGFDYIWGITNSDLNEMAAGYKGFVESGNAMVMGPRFGALASCTSSISLTEQTRAGSVGTGEDRLPDAMVETHSCQLRTGSDMEDVEKAVEYWQEQFEEIESAALGTYEGFLVRPFRGMREGLDFAWIGTYPDLTTFMQGATDYYGSKEGQAADARFQKTSKCQTAMWNGYWVVVPENRQ